MQSPKNFCKAIARTLTINKTPAPSATNNAITNNSNNTASANQNEHDSEQHLFETNRIEDIQATSILRSLMQSYSMQSMSNKTHNNTNNLGDVVMTSEDDNDEHDDEIRSIGAGSCTNYVDFDEHDEYEADHDGVDENNDTFLVNIDDGEYPNQDQQLTFLNLASANRNPSELQPDLIHNRKRKINESNSRHQMY